MPVGGVERDAAECDAGAAAPSTLIVAEVRGGHLAVAGAWIRIAIGKHRKNAVHARACVQLGFSLTLS